MPRKKQIVVIGSSDETVNLSEAAAIGRFIAAQGFILITGGRGGVMEAVSRGAAENGGTVIGILPGENLDSANRYCSVVIPTGLGFARNAVNVLAADVVIAIGGRSGTLTELAYSRLYGKPLICCTFSGGWSEEFSRAPADGRDGSPVYTARTAEEACGLITSILGGN